MATSPGLSEQDFQRLQVWKWILYLFDRLSDDSVFAGCLGGAQDQELPAGGDLQEAEERSVNNNGHLIPCYSIKGLH